jgi:hypothetical protein
MVISKILNSVVCEGLHLKFICIGLLILTSCGKQIEKSTKVKKKFSPSEYVVLTNLNLNKIQPTWRKQLIDDLNLLPCKCLDCTPGISLAQCVSTNNYCAYSKAETGKIIKTYQIKYYTNSKLTFSIWDASRSGDINGIFRQLARNTPVDFENVKGETSLLLSIKSNNLESSAFLVLSGAKLDKEDKNGITPTMILEEKEWANNIKDNLKMYNDKFTIPIHEILNKVIDKVGWNLDKTKLLSIKFKKWPDMAIGENSENAQLQVIITGIEMIINFNNKNHELKLLYEPVVKYIKLVELESEKVLLYEGRNF